MSLNTCNLETRIQQKLDGLTTSNDSIEFVVTGLSGFDNVKSSVANTASLPNIYTDGIPNGTVVFVESLGVPVIASCNKWLGLDGRFLQRDAQFGLWSMGLNVGGRLGDGTTTNKSSPVSVVGGFTDWCQVSVDVNHGAALRQNGTIWSWGYNSLGSLGDGTTTNKSSPVSVVGGFTDWCQMDVGNGHTLALRSNGTLWSWGWNNSGRLGDGTTVNKSSPVSVVGGFTDWCQVSAGSSSSAGIRTNGTLWSWGFNGSNSLLGDGTIVDKSSPVSVVGGFTDWCQVSAGGSNIAAVRRNGTLWIWGNGANGRLGDGTTVTKCSPVSVIGGFADWCQVSVGGNHTAAVRTNGTIWSWGFGEFGRLGNGYAQNVSSPVSVIGGFTDWCQVSAGDYHTAAVRQNGTLWAWGNNGFGRLGDGTIVNKCSPVSVLGGFTDWCQVSVASFHSIAISACIL